MKKTIVLFITLAMLFAFSACGAENVSYNTADAADKLVQTIAFDDEMTEMPESMITKLYGIASDSIVSSKVYMSTGATAEEVAAFEAKDSNGAKAIEAAVKARIEKQKASFRDYIPEEMPKLESPVIITDGNYIFLCISNQNDKAKEIIDSLKQTD